MDISLPIDNARERLQSFNAVLSDAPTRRNDIIEEELKIREESTHSARIAI
jgi:hypothetical protein